MDCRSVESVDNCFTMPTVSALRRTASTRPITRRICCVRYLYQPETRSIELLYQASRFFCSLAASLPAILIMAAKGLPTFSVFGLSARRWEAAFKEANIAAASAAGGFGATTFGGGAAGSAGGVGGT